MPIIGLNLTSMNATAESKNITANINVNSTPSIERVEKRELDVPGVKDILAVGFRFRSQYEPNVGEIAIEGEILYQSDKSKEILGKWKKDRRLDDALAAELLNAIFRKCLTEAIHLSQELRIPPPIQFPVVMPKEEKS